MKTITNYKGYKIVGNGFGLYEVHDENGYAFIEDHGFENIIAQVDGYIEYCADHES